MPVLSVAYYAGNEEIKKAVLESDMIRNKTLDACYAIPFYAELPHAEKRKIYDCIRDGYIHHTARRV